MTNDSRYHSRRWRTTRERVLTRDLWRCQVVPGCAMKGDVCDHVEPVYEGMPDSEFYDEGNLRAACRTHNVARGFAATLAEAGSTARPNRYSYGRASLRVARVF